ncbi:MAG: hypothetical protein DHS20C05_20940 [Hyphococcus sp.]|nr:MAG: hypothetical protein DHS20C05_20940 [Marinicaulis sp.]
MPGFLMLSGPSPAAVSGNTPQLEAKPEARLGLTVTKKIGGAVIRNRIRRRLRAAAREVFPQYAKAGRDYVLIARKAAYDRNYQALLDDLKRALLRLHPRP